MRYDTPIFFQKIREPVYNEAIGNYEDEKVDESERYASVMDTSTETLVLIYGGIKQGSLSIHLQNRYTDEFDFIRVGAKRYRVDKSTTLRTKQSFIVSEV